MHTKVICVYLLFHPACLIIVKYFNRVYDKVLMQKHPLLHPIRKLIIFIAAVVPALPAFKQQRQLITLLKPEAHGIC